MFSCSWIIIWPKSQSPYKTSILILFFVLFSALVSLKFLEWKLFSQNSSDYISSNRHCDKLHFNQGSFYLITIFWICNVPQDWVLFIKISENISSLQIKFFYNFEKELFVYVFFKLNIFLNWTQTRSLNGDMKLPPGKLPSKKIPTQDNWHPGKFPPS